ncbi:DUF3078 domain-containing protein [Paucihalobacter ruber]|uniref:DUF3078 domain-containing protein n=1 Tax=Paucihalobacter ruber TaxID=2567861 RepID=A0A506PMQ7_9FLAO|nr:DUF3078 domain-containing protein [Paucihalobacter ruber]TPV34818.1 DUF3078 domain-containing protein [Paucihalobacter ruber]
MKKLGILITLLSFGFVNAQTLDELKALQQEKKDSIAAIQSRVDGLQSQIDAFPGWRIGAFGTIGGSLSQFSNWYAQGVPNNASGNIGFTFNAYANLIEEKFFWRNALTTNLNWVKLDNKDNPNDNDSFEPTTDVFNISSLYGRNITKKIAASALMEYRTTILNNFNDPGYLDLGVGFTWTPVENLLVVVHPLNYNFVFSSGGDIFESSLGAKIMADYTRSIGAVNFKSNLSMFQSYKSSNLSNWTWTNSFSYSLWKAIGVGFDFGLRDSRQEALNYAVNTLGDPNATFDNIDNDLQTFWTLGLSYKF